VNVAGATLGGENWGGAVAPEATKLGLGTGRDWSSHTGKSLGASLGPALGRSVRGSSTGHSLGLALGKHWDALGLELECLRGKH
jgi:hypothetical protein